MDPPQSSAPMLLINACETESHMYNRPTCPVSGRQFDVAIRQVNEPANNLCRLSLIGFAPVTPENSKTQE
jgi:hypothetical protein